MNKRTKKERGKRAKEAAEGSQVVKRSDPDKTPEQFAKELRAKSADK